MKPDTKHLLTLSLLVIAGALLAAACGSPAPIAVYVTPTPESAGVEGQPGAGLNPALGQSASVQNAAAARQVTTTPAPTGAPNTGFGPIIGPNYTVEPLATALPETVREQTCTGRVAVSELAIYATPDLNAQVIRTAVEREQLTVLEIPNPNAERRWARGEQGWFLLADTGRELVNLREVHRCDILMGRRAPTALMGLHVLNDTQTDAALNLVRRLAAAGHPMATIKGLNGTEDFLEQVKQVSPQTVTVYRSLIGADGLSDCPQDIYDGVFPDPVAEAERWIRGLEPYWSQVDADYYELMNECPAPLSWINDFSIEAMKIANAQGRCLLLFSFPGGTPQMSEFDQLLPAYRFAVENPCQPGRHHGIAMHAYSLEDNQLTSESSVHIALRHRVLEERLQRVYPEGLTLPVFITEFGIGGGTIMPSCEMITQDVLQYTYQLEEDPYVVGFHLWSVGYGAQWYDITPCLPVLGDQVIAYYNGS